MNHHRGFILLVMLIFIQIHCLLSMAILQKSLFAEKINIQQQNTRRLTNKSEQVFKQIEQKIFDVLPSCRISSLSYQQLHSAWWLSRACSETLEDFHYYYVIEKLGTNAKTSNNTQPVTYYRISLCISKKPQILISQKIITKTLDHQKIPQASEG